MSTDFENFFYNLFFFTCHCFIFYKNNHFLQHFFQFLYLNEILLEFRLIQTIFNIFFLVIFVPKRMKILFLPFLTQITPCGGMMFLKQILDKISFREEINSCQALPSKIPIVLITKMRL